MRIVALGGTLLGGVSAGKWDRFATFGEKVQDGQAFSFTVETFGQMVDNFARLYSGRRLGMDYEHQAINAAQNGRAAPNLAYYNALAVVESGKVAKFYAQQPDVPPPDPVSLLVQLRERFPEHENADGLWAYRCEVTPLGQELLPNYEQISPLFTAEGTDEQGNPIDYHLLNASAVSVAFQDGTVLNLSGAHAALSKQGAAMAEKDPKEEGEGKNALRSECMKKFGLPEDAEDAAMYGAIMATKFAGDAEESDEDKKKKEAESAMAAAPEMPAAMSAIKSRLDEEAKRNAANEAELAVLRQERQIRRAGEWRAFSAMFLADEPAEKFLKEHGGDVDKATRALSALDLPRRTGLSQRLTQDGQPVGGDAVQAGSSVEHVAGLKVIGRGLSAMAQTILQKGEAKTLGEAQILAARRAPHLYSR